MTPRAPSADPSHRARVLLGTLSGAAAYGLWGLFPIYFTATASVPALQVLCHRIVGSGVVLAVILTVTGGWRRLGPVVRNRCLMALLALSATVIGLNWGVFIWAVTQNRVLDSSLGYYIAPLASVVLGVVALGERLSRWQAGAVLLAGLGVFYQVIGVGSVPWLALVLACSFSVYGLLRKIAAVDAVGGLFIEAVVLSPFAILYLIASAMTGDGAFGHVSLGIDVLLILAGPVTALPLILFVAAARRIRLATVGLLQYITPTGHFLLAVLLYGEPFTGDHLVSFGLIWTALVFYSLGAGRRPPAG